MGKTKLDEIVESMPGAQRRFVEKQGEIATHIWRIMSSKKPAWTQRDLARKAKMKESYVSYLLSGVANPTLKTICALEEALGGDIIVAPSLRRTKELAANVQPARTVRVPGNVITMYPESDRAEDKNVTLASAPKFAASGT